MRFVLCVWSWHSLDHLPFDDGWLVCPLAFRHKKGEYFGVSSLYFVVFFLFFKGSLFVFGWSLWSFRLYLGASLCTYAFLALTLFFDRIFLLGGVLCLIGTLFVSCFKLLIDLYL